MRTKILMLVMLISLVAVAIAKSADNDPGKSLRGDDKQMRMDGNQRGPGNGLNLTDEQKEAFKQSMMATQKQLQPLRNELGEVTARQKTLMTAEAPDMNAINENIEKMGAVKVKMEKIQAKQRLDMRAQLTDEQLLKFDMHKGGRMQHKGPEGMRQGRGIQQNHSRN